MTYEEFSKKFHDISKEHEPILSNGGWRIFMDELTFCPITAIYYYEVGEFVSLDDVITIYKDLGLDSKLADLIIGAADFPYPPPAFLTSDEWLTDFIRQDLFGEVSENA